jgi:hypothetical protein
LDILSEEPAVGTYIDSNTPPDVAARVRAMDQAGRGQIDKGYYDNQSADVKSSMLQQVGQAPMDPNAQTADQREAGTQAKINKGTITRQDAANRATGGDYFQDTKVATSKPTTATQSVATSIQPAATPVDFNKRAGVMSVADTGLGRLSGGVSLSGGAADYMNPSMRAELANQSGGKFVADVGQQTQQLGYQQKFGDNTTGQLAINRNAQGGMSAGIGGETKLGKDWSLTGGVSTPVHGQGDTQFNVGLKRNL